MPPRTEADTCRQYVLPELYAAGWDDDRIAEQRTFTDGRIVVTGSKVRRRPGKRADYILRYRADMPIPAPALGEQRCIVAYLDDLQTKVDRLKALQAQTAAELDALLPGILDKAFQGAL